MIDLNQLFNDSYERISENSDEFFDAFYKSFLGKSKEIDQLFTNVDMEKQKIVLRESLVYMISFYSTKVAGDYLIELADLHQNKLKITPSMYQEWLDALIEALTKVDKIFNKDVELAWRITLSPGIEFMQHYSKKSN